MTPLAPASSASDVVYRRVTLRFLPLLFLSYVFNYVDRTNIGFAQLQMKGDLGLSEVAYGLGAGIFFITYSLFAVPSNLMLTRIGARKTIFLSLLLWGITSSCTMFVQTAMQFYLLRGLLGIVEAGFFPGVIYYFTQWYPSYRRANVTGIFQSATVVAGVVSGVASGALIAYLNGHAHLRGWQWMFLVEGMPSVVMAFLVWFYLDDVPSSADWLSASEKAVIIDALKSDPAVVPARHSVGEILANGRVYLLGVIFFLAVIGTYVLAFWQPAMIRDMGVSSILRIGIYSTIPSIAAVIAKIWIGYHSDKTHELTWHFAAAAFSGALGMLLLPVVPHNAVLGIACLTLATAGVHACIPIFWAIPGLYLSGTAAAAGIALISTMGNIAGFIGPTSLGYIKKATNSFAAGMWIMSGMLIVGGFLILAMNPDRERARPSGHVVRA
jgi:sugar phosphate permease